MTMDIKIENIIAEINVFKILGVVLKRFYEKTGITGSFTVSYAPDHETAELSFYFNKEPSEKDYGVLFDELIDSEKIILNEYVLSVSSSYENLNQLIFKHKQDLKQIFKKRGSGG